MSFRNFFAVRFVCRKKLGNIWSICSCFNQPSRSHRNRRKLHEEHLLQKLGLLFQSFPAHFCDYLIIEKIKEAKGVSLSALSLSAELTHNTPGVDPRLITDAEL